MEEKSAKVIVKTIESIDEFYVIPESLMENVESLHERLQEAVKNERRPSEVVIGVVYMAQHAQSKQWFRVRVRKLLENQECEIFYVDFGKTEIICKNRLKTCSGSKNQANSCIARCKLAIPQSFERPSNSSLKHLFKFLVSNKRIFKMIVKSYSDTPKEIFTVDLQTVERIQNFSLVDYILSIHGIEINPRIGIELKPIKKLQIADKTVVKVRHIESPSEIYISNKDLNEDEVVMKLEMSEFYNANPVNFALLVPGVICAIEESLFWVRVEVLASPNTEGKCPVRYIDDGGQELVEWQRLYELDRQFYDFPEFASKCCLADIEPTGCLWSKEGTNFLRSSMIDSDVEIEFTGTLDSATLLVYHEDNKINMNESLVFMKFAQFTNGSETVIPYEPIEDQKSHRARKYHEIEIIDQKNLDGANFQIRFTEFNDAVNVMTRLIQAFSNSLEKQDDWKTGEVCLVYIRTSKYNDLQWYRGFVNGKTEKGYSVICDLGIKKDLKLKYLRKCPEIFSYFGSSVISIKLACEIAKVLTKDDQETFKLIVGAYNRFFINFKDDNRVYFRPTAEPRPAILWGQQEIGVKVNIVNELEENGLVVAKYQEKKTVVDYWNTDLLIDEVKKDFFAPCTIPVGCYEVQTKKQVIDSWLPNEIIRYDVFSAIGTNVDRDGNILLYEASHDAQIQHMNEVINQYFEGKPKKKFHFKVGDPCLVLYDSDALYYRGKIIEIIETNCSVMFIDYGNIQRNVDMKDLFGDVICSEIPSQLNKFRLEGEPTGVDGETDQELLDKLQTIIVDKRLLIQVRKNTEKFPNPFRPKPCWITVDGILIKRYQDIESLFPTA